MKTIFPSSLHSSFFLQEEAEKLLLKIIGEDYESLLKIFQHGASPRNHQLKAVRGAFSCIQQVYVNLEKFDNALVYGEICKMNMGEMKTLTEHWPQRQQERVQQFYLQQQQQQNQPPQQQHSPLAYFADSRWTLGSLINCISQLQQPCLTYSIINPDSIFAWFISANGSVAFHWLTEPELEDKLRRHLKNMSKPRLEDGASLEIRIPLGRMLDGSPEDDKLFKYKFTLFILLYIMMGIES